MRLEESKFKKIMAMIFKTIQIIVVLLLILIGFAFWKLSVSPMSVDSWVPKIGERLLPADFDLKLQAKGAYLKTNFNRFGLIQITIEDLTLTQSDGTVLTRLPSVDMVYGLRKLLKLDYIPNRLTIQKPTVQFVIDPQGRWMFQSNHKQGAKQAEELLADLKKKENKTGVFTLTEKQVHQIAQYVMSFNRIQIVDGEILLDDQQNHKTLSMPRFDLSLEREQKAQFRLKMDSEVQAQEISAHLGINALLDKKTKTMPFDIYFDSVDLSSFSEINAALADIKMIVKGNLTGTFDLTDESKKGLDMVKDVAFKIQNQKVGTVNLPAPLTNVYPVQSLLIQGAFSPDFKSLNIQNSSAVLTTGPKADIQLDVQGLDGFWTLGDINQIKTVLKAEVNGATIEQVPDLWPSALGPDAHAWVKQNLSDGKLDKAVFTLYFTGAELVDLLGDIDVSGVRVDYLNPMPVVENVAGKVYLYPDKVEIFANAGHVGNLMLKKADLYLTDLKKTGLADIRIQAEGPVQEALALIDYKPLEFAKMFNLNPAQTGGVGDVSLTLNFPFKPDLKISDVKTKVDAQIKDGIFPLPFGHQSITDGVFNLSVSNQQLNLIGTANFETYPLNIQWDEFFQPIKQNGKEVKTKYIVSGEILTEALKTFYADIADYVDGQINVGVDFTTFVGGQSDVLLKMDLKEAFVKIYPISLIKEKGKSLQADVSLGLKNNALVYPIQFNVKGDNQTQIKGMLNLSDGFVLDLENVKTDINDFVANIKRDTQGNLSVIVSGKLLNMSKIKEMPLFKQTQTSGEQINIPNAQAVPPDVKLDVRLDRFYMVPDKPILNLHIDGVRQGYYWQNLSAELMADKLFQLTFTPENKTLKAQSDNIGDLIARLGGSDRIIGGRLFVLATQPYNGGFNGEISVKNFELKDMGFLTQALTILGIVDALRGKEMHFNQALIPFELTPHQTLFINEGYANGTAVGITFNGRVSLDNINLAGSVIPAYAINSLPGKIPLVGGLFKDGAGGGLMGVRYELKGTPAHPETNFNTLSSFAPGILGKLFN